MYGKRIWSDPAERRRWITLASGLLIALALLSGRVPGWGTARTALMVGAALLAGGDVAARAWSALRVRHLGIELLVTIAAVGALAIGEVWEAAAVTFLFALGGYLEARTLSGTRRAIEALLEVAPATAVVLRVERHETVPAHEVQVGEIVLVRPGAKVPVDGEVTGGHGAVDESAITGESVPVEKGPGDAALAGTLNQGGLLRVRATGVGADTTLARIIRRVEEAQEAKAPSQRFIERFARAVGIDEVHAGLLPGDKLEWIRRLQREGEVVAMVGDGIDDAPALAQADVGIAMGAAGTDVSIETADVTLVADDLEKIPRAIELSKRTLATMRQNLALALLTVGALLAGVLAGEVHMAGC